MNPSTEYLPRDRSIYVSARTKRRLRWICENMNADVDANKWISHDQLAEQLLNNEIERLYPSLPKMEKRMKALEDQMIQELSQTIM